MSPAALIVLAALMAAAAFFVVCELALVSPRRTRLLGAIGVALRPLIRLLGPVTDLVLTVVRTGRGPRCTDADVRALIAQGARGGTLDASQAAMLRGVFVLRERCAHDVMTRVPDLTCVAPRDSVRDALKVAVAAGHSRLPVIDSAGALHGVASDHDLIGLLLGGRDTDTVASVIREAVIVPESKPLDELLGMLQAAHVTLACVVDEYGMTAGVVSVEDIVEEIVGEIDDETDRQQRHAVPDGPHAWLIDGQVALRDLRGDGFALPEPAGTYATLAGLLLHRAGRVPDEGETVALDDWQATVTRRDGTRIAAVRLASSPPTTVTAAA